MSDQQARRSGVGEGNLSWHGRCDGTGVSRGGLPAGCAPEGWRAGAGGRAAHLLCAALGTLNATLYRKAFRGFWPLTTALGSPRKSKSDCIGGVEQARGKDPFANIFILIVRKVMRRRIT